MRKIAILFIYLLAGIWVKAQNPATVFSFPDTVLIGFDTTCKIVRGSTLNIKQTTDYVVNSMPYLPYAYKTPGGNIPQFLSGSTLTNIITVDDRFSNTINMGFPICFFGTNYSKVVIGCNSIITFDTANANRQNAWPLTVSSVAQPIPYAGGTINTASPAYYPKASIMGPYYDAYPVATATGKKIEWRVEGVAPNRRFIVSYDSIPAFSCNTQINRHMLMIYEGTGVIESYINSKAQCNTWNSGLAILGIQNEARNKAVAAPGKNATVWGSANMNEAYRFTPSGGTSSFRRAQIICGGSVVATADTISGGLDTLRLSFNICPTADTSTCTFRVVYNVCPGSGMGLPDSVVYQKSVFIRWLNLRATITKVDESCLGAANGSINATAAGGTGGYSYSLNGSAFQSSGMFNSLTSGSYTITVRDGTGYTKNFPITIGALGALNLVSSADTSFCSGFAWQVRTTSNGTMFSWSPTAGVSNATIANPILSPTISTQYILTANLAGCVKKDTVNVTILPTPMVDAGNPQIILNGESVTLFDATSTPGSYTWIAQAGTSTPSGTASTMLNPTFMPIATTLYTLTTTSSQGCKASDTVRITVIPYCVKPMLAFTPNGDGFNDLWLATDGNCVKNITAGVYNRYGREVYYSNDYKNTWNGTYKGKPLPDGTYYFVLTYTLLNGKREQYKNNVSILR
jgi:gliding motility-associated-like protein